MPETCHHPRLKSIQICNEQNNSIRQTPSQDISIGISLPKTSPRGLHSAHLALHDARPSIVAHLTTLKPTIGFDSPPLACPVRPLPFPAVPLLGGPSKTQTKTTTTMKTHPSILSATGAIAAILSATMFPVMAADSRAKEDMQKSSNMKNMDSANFSRLVSAVHPLGDEDHKVKGTIVFDKQSDESVKVTANLSGLESEKQYIVSIHQFGDLGSPNADSVGSRFDSKATSSTSPGSIDSSATSARSSENPSNQDNANTTGETTSGIASQPGDLGIVTGDNNGMGKLETTVREIELTSGAKGILGRAVVVHQKSNESRAAMDQTRVAAGVIGISKDGMDPAMSSSTNSSQTNPADASSTTSPTDAASSESRRNDTAIENNATPQGRPTDPTR